MESERLLEELKTVVERCGISYELRDLSDNELNIRSGLCEVDCGRKLIIDRRLTDDGRIKIIVETLRSENLDSIFIPPAVREIIEPCEE
ncbi:MAG: hypothetical protein ACE5EN_06615 [Nitrospinota bacterium]